MLQIVLQTKSAGFRQSFSKKAKCLSTYRVSGGGRGIRTPGTVSRTVVFKTTRFNRSRIPPLLEINKLRLHNCVAL